MNNLPRIPYKGPYDILHCPRCGKTVDEVEFDAPGEEYNPETGDVIITVHCHGETWRMSNVRGRLDQ